MKHPLVLRLPALSFACIVIALGTLSACGGSDLPEVTPVVTPGGCPRIAVVRDLSIYQHPPAADESNLVINARMGRIVNNCTTDDNGNGISDPTAQTSFDVVAMRGANTAGKRAAIPFSVSVVDEQNNVLKKEVYEIPIQFRDNSRELQLTVPVNPSIGIPSGQDASKYMVLLGFQLSAAQLKANMDYFASIAPPTPDAPPPESSPISTDPTTGITTEPASSPTAR